MLSNIDSQKVLALPTFKTPKHQLDKLMMINNKFSLQWAWLDLGIA